MNKILLAAVVSGLPFFVTGCASVTGTPNQSISVQTREQGGAEVVGASCELVNDEGKWFVTTPGSVSIHRSNKDLQVSCKKENIEPGRAAVVSDTKSSMFGNIILGGGIGAIIDHNNGSAYEYPTVIDVLMGTFTKITKKSQSQSMPVQAVSVPVNSQPVQTASSQAAPQPLQIASAQSGEEKLRELKKLYDAGLISKEVYADRQRAILSQ